MTFEYPAEVVFERAEALRTLDRERTALQAHIAADHEVLKRIWDLHRSDNFLSPYCTGCELAWPCPTIRAFDAAI